MSSTYYLLKIFVERAVQGSEDREVTQARILE